MVTLRKIYMEVVMKKGNFSSLREKILWLAFKMTGNPYIFSLMKEEEKRHSQDKSRNADGGRA